MDKIRENFFAISVGVLGVGLLVLIFVMIIQPRFLGDLGEVAALESKRRTLERYADSKKTPQLPTPELFDASKDRNEKLDSELSSAIELIEEKAKRFNEFLLVPSFLQIPPPPGIFQPTYVTENDKLVDAYQDEYPESLPDDAGQGGQRKRDAFAGIEVLRMKSFNTETDVLRGMKEFWMTQRFFESATKLDLGGLKKIEFLRKPVDGLPSHYNAVHAKVEIDLPMTMLGEFIASVFESDRVPFELVKVSVTRLPETLISGLVKVVTYGDDNEEDSRRQEDLEAHPGDEPLVKAVIDFHGIDWKGFLTEDPGKRVLGKRKR